MSVRYGKKISELSALNSASLQTYIVGVDNDVTYKISLDVLEDAVVNMVSTSTDSRLDSLEAYTASGGGNISTTSLNSFTASAGTRLYNLESNTSSYAVPISPEDYRVAAFSSSNSLVKTQIWDDGTTTVIGGTSISDPTNPEKLFVNGGDIGSFNLISGHATRDNYIQLNIKNFSSGTTASADIVATNERGDETGYYIDMGINGDGYNSPGGVGKNNDAYVYSTGYHLHIGNASNYPINFFAGGMDSEANQKFTINPNNQHELTGSLTSDEGFYGAIYAYNGVISSSAQISDLGFVTSTTGTPAGTVSGSSQLTASFDNRYVLSGSVQNITLPANLISSSAQITAFGFVSGTYETTGRGIISSSANLVTTSSFNAYTASQSTSSLVNRLNAIENVSGSWITESETGSFLRSLNGAISSSAQITAFGFVSGSYETTGRGILSGSISYNSLTNIPSAIVSGSAQITSFGFVSGSYETIGRGIVSSSTQISSLGFAQLNGGNTFNGIQIFNDTIQVNAVTASSLTVTTFYAVSSSVAATSGSTSFGSINSDIMFVTGSIRVTNEISASTINGLGNATQYSSSVNTKINSLQAATESYETKGRGIISGSAQLPSGLISGSSQLTSSYDLRYAFSASYLTSLNGAISSSIQVLGGSGVWSGSGQLPSGIISGSSQLSSGIVSGSSQLTSSYDSRYTLSGSISAVPTGTISGSSQLTSSFDTRYTLSGSVGAVPVGTISGSAQITAFGFVSSSTGTPAGTISGSSQLTASFDSRYTQTASFNLFTSSENAKATTLATYTASNDTKWTMIGSLTGSYATTGANVFNGNQIITGSLNITTGNIVASAITANTSSLYLTSGSNLYIQNNGTLEITGSAVISGSTTFTGSIRISSGSITMPNRPAFRVTGAGGPTSAVTTLSGSMTSVDYNQGGWDNATGTFTAPIAGLYQVNLVCRTYSNASSAGQIIVFKNNTSGANGTPQIMIEWAANTTMNHTGGSTISKLEVGDTLKAVVAVGTLSFDGNDNFSVAYIG